MTPNDFFVALGQLSGLLFIVTSMLAMGMSLTMAQICVEQPRAKSLITVNGRVSVSTHE